LPGEVAVYSLFKRYDIVNICTCYCSAQTTSRHEMHVFLCFDFCVKPR